MQIIIYMKVFTGPHISITQWHWQWRTTFFWPKTLDYLSNFGLVWQVSWCTNFLRLTQMRHKEEYRVFQKKSCATLVLPSLNCYGSFEWNKKYSLKIWIEKSSECFHQMYKMSSRNISIWLPECLGALRQTADICGEMIFRSRRRHSTNKKC